METTFHIRIKKDYAVAVIEDLQKMNAIELIDENEIPEWQKQEVRRRVAESKNDPSILLDEKVVFDLLKVE